LMPPFKTAHVERYRDGIQRVAEEEIGSWPLNEQMQMLPRMQRVALNVIMTTTFGGTEGEQLETLRDRVHNLLEWAGSPLHMGHLHLAHRRGKAYPKGFVRVRDELDESIFDVIESTRKDPNLEERDDVLSMLIQARWEDGNPLTERQLRDQLVTLMIQGHSTTATGLAWALERMTRHPEVMDRLREEAEANGGDEYLTAVVKETLRARPPLPIAGAREVSRPFRLGDHEIPADTLVAACIYLVHRHERLFPDPDAFRPERFLDGAPGGYEWIPFGGGHRHCIGASFSMLQMKVVLREIVLRTRLEAVDRADEAIQRRGVGFSPARGARVVVKERVPAGGAASVAA
jgi:cytochrome P450